MTVTELPPLALKLKDAANLVGCSPAHLRAEWHARRITLKNKGTKSKPMFVVEYSELKRWLDDMPTAVPGQ